MAGVLMPTCRFCGGPVSPSDPATWQRVVGWQRIAGVRASGKHGGSDIRLREPLQEWAHPYCVSAAKSGVLGQESML
jgi:hypothetical protein